MSVGQLDSKASDLLQDQKNIDRALQMYVKAIRLQPKNIWAANGIGQFLLDSGLNFKRRLESRRIRFVHSLIAIID